MPYWMLRSLLYDGAWLAVLANDVALLVLKVIDALYRTDDGSRATGSGLLECLQLLLGNLPALHLHAKVQGQLHEALVGDARQDAGTLGRDVRILLYAEEIGGTALVDVLLLLCVEVELATVAQVVSHLVGTKAGSVIATHLVDTRAKGRAAVVLADDDIRIGGKASLEVRPHRSYEDDEQVFLGGMYAHLCAGAYQQGTDVQGGSALVGRDVLLVEPHYLLHHLD